MSTLKESGYKPYLMEAEEKLHTPKRVDYQLRKRLASDYLGILQAAPGEAHAILTQLYRHFEIENLKAVLRGINSNASWERVRFVLFPLGSFSKLPYQQMMETGSIEQAVELLSKTPYYAALSYALERYSTEQSLFPLEVSQDISYWRALWKHVGMLSGQDREQARRIIGPLVDVTNLIWAIRYKVYHNLAEEEIINYTLSFGYHVRDADIRAIAAGMDIAEVVMRLYPDLENVENLLQDPQHGLPKLELQLQRYIVQKCKNAFAGYPFHVGIPLAYLLLKEFEIQDLTVLLEAKAAGLPAEEFVPYMVTISMTGENAVA